MTHSIIVGFFQLNKNQLRNNQEVGNAVVLFVFVASKTSVAIADTRINLLIYDTIVSKSIDCSR